MADSQLEIDSSMPNRLIVTDGVLVVTFETSGTYERPYFDDEVEPLFSAITSMHQQLLGQGLKVLSVERNEWAPEGQHDD